MEENAKTALVSHLLIELERLQLRVSKLEGELCQNVCGKCRQKNLAPSVERQQATTPMCVDLVVPESVNVASPAGSAGCVHTVVPEESGINTLIPC